VITVKTKNDDDLNAQIFEVIITRDELIDLDLSAEDLIKMKKANETANPIFVAEDILMNVKKIEYKRILSEFKGVL